MIAPLARNEEERLGALHRYEVLDTGPEQDFDDITLLASQICGTPIAMISLVDENRQWFKSKLGTTASETPRDIAFCAHGILESEVFVVPDARADQRFAANPLVTGETQIRFYAGAPLVTSDGHALGMLCVTDQVPRAISEAQKSALQALSRQVVGQLELRRSLTELERTGKQYAGLVNSMDGIVWEANATTLQFTFVSEQAARILGFPPAQWLCRPDFWINQIHPEDRQRAVSCYLACSQTKEKHTFEYRMLAADGRVVWVRDILTYVETAGKPAVLRGIMLDITVNKQTEDALRESERRFSGMLGNLELVSVMLDRDGRVTYCNDYLLRLTDWRSEEVIGRNWFEVFVPDEVRLEVQGVHTALLADQPAAWHHENEILTCSGARRLITWNNSVLRSASGEAIGIASIGEDITERKRLEAARERLAGELQESQRFAENIAENSTSTIYLFDLETHTCVYSNRSAAESLGYSPAQIREMGDHFLQAIIHPDDLPRVSQQQAHFAEVMDGQVFDLEFRVKSASGEWRWTWSRETVFKRRPDGAPWLIMGTAQDITQRKESDLALWESEERFRLVARATDDAIWDWNIVADCISFSESFGSLFGYRAGAFEATMVFWTNSIHPDDHDKVLDSVHAFLTSREEVWVGEYRFRCSDGSYASVFDRGYVVRDPAGKPLRMVGSMMNITARKRAEEELCESKRALEAALHTNQQIMSYSLDVICIIDGQGRFSTVNAACHKLWGYLPSELLGQRYMDFVHPEDRPATIEIAAAIARGQPVVDFENRYVRKDGSLVPVTWSAYWSEADQSMFCVARDATERHRVESALQAAKTSAEAASRAKSEFLANMSHEIRTPMNGIIGMTQLVLETELNREQREYLGMAKSSAHSLLGLINDILDFSKIEAGKLELEAISFSLRDCVGTMLKPLGLRADQKGLELTAEIPAEVPDHLIGDPLRLRQILINLTDNAIKFTKQGDVMLRVLVESVNDHAHCLHFSVTDTGIGIPREKQALIFDAFAQADGTTTRIHGGTGLGLAIASRIVREMGGRIWVESTPGEGSAFHFTALLPVRATPAPSVRHADPHHLEGLRVLVVDDNAVNRRILREMLANWRMQPSVVASGATAIVEMLRAAHGGTPFPLVILDGMMPEMDGFMVAEKIREHAELSGATVMMLSSAMPTGAAARCAELGVASYLTKPVNQHELLDAILIAIGGAIETSSKAETPPVAREADGLRILLAEDNAINSALVTGILKKRGHFLVLARNGREAVEAAARDAYDLILMDVQMPVMDGFSATRCIREVEQLTGRCVPIVAMTAHAMAGDRERCLAAGMDDYLSKPLHKSELLALLDRVARRRAAAEPQEPRFERRAEFA